MSEAWTAEAMQGFDAVCLTRGLAVAEGPTVLADGSVAFVEMRGGTVCRWSGQGGHEVVAALGGGPNAVVRAGTTLYVTQNGGTDGDWRSSDPRTPAIEAIDADGSVRTLTTGGEGLRLRAPNDLVFGVYGDLFFTDPGQYRPTGAGEEGRIFALRPDGRCECVCETGATFPNGVAIAPDGRLVWTESYSGAVCRLDRAGEREVICELAAPAIPDGLCIDGRGLMYVAGTESGAIEVLRPDGEPLGRIPVGVQPTNACLDGERMYVTDGGNPGEDDGALYEVWLGRSVTPGEGPGPTS